MASAKISSLLVKVYVSVAVARKAVAGELADGAAEKAEVEPQKARRAEAIASFMVVVV